jgi:hypothetical protein
MKKIFAIIAISFMFGHAIPSTFTYTYKSITTSVSGPTGTSFWSAQTSGASSISLTNLNENVIWQNVNPSQLGAESSVRVSQVVTFNVFFTQTNINPPPLPSTFYLEENLKGAGAGEVVTSPSNATVYDTLSLALPASSPFVGFSIGANFDGTFPPGNSAPCVGAAYGTKFVEFQNCVWQQVVAGSNFNTYELTSPTVQVTTLANSASDQISVNPHGQAGNATARGQSSMSLSYYFTLTP